MSNEEPNPWFSLIPRKGTKADPQPGITPRHSTLNWEFGAEEAARWEVTTSVIPQRESGNRAAPPHDSAAQAQTATPPRIPVRTTTVRSQVIETPLIDLTRNESGARQLLATRMALDEALDHWWTNGELPALTLLRDGLLVLEGGHALDETHRSFLLRVALRRQRGMVTALRHQGDPDRTAFLLKDALLDLNNPLPATVLAQLQQEDAQSAIWTDYLLHDLHYELGVAQGKRRQLVVRALAQLQGTSPLWVAANQLVGQDQAIPLSYRWSLRWLFWGFCVLALAVGYGVLHRTVYAQTVRIPAGSYTISDPTGVGQLRTVLLETFHVDQTEVTNRAYARCVADGVCLSPSSDASATRESYFSNAVYADFPVIHIDWDGANAYCTWLNKRLPTVEEWEVAAGVAPLTQRYFRYPWGDRFEANFVNGGTPFVTDTRAVGAFHPVGDSSFGARDMAGNVAEWTATPATGLDNGFVVKGGSYGDDAEALRLDVQQALARTLQAPWLGFRCASD